MAFCVTCPHCQAVLKSAVPIPAGRKVKCSKCATPFETRAAQEPAVTAAVGGPSEPGGSLDFDPDIIRLVDDTPSPAEIAAAAAKVKPPRAEKPVPAEAVARLVADAAPRSEKPRLAASTAGSAKDDMRVARKPHADEQDDERPARKNRRDEDEDGSRSRKRRDDDEDEPHRRNQDDRDAEDDRPLKKPQRKKGGSIPGMTVGIVVFGGVLAVVGCTGCAGLGYWLYTSVGASPIVGNWEPTNNPQGISLTFESNGRGRFNARDLPVPVNFKYRLNDNTLQMEADDAGNQDLLFARRRESRISVTFNSRDQMSFRNLDQPNQPEARFRRAK